MLFRIARIVPLALALAFAFTAQASAATNVYLAIGTGDAQVAPCQESAVFEGFTYFRCDSLRAAVDAANAHANSADDAGDVIFLQSDSPYTVNQPLTLTERVSVYGRGPRTTTVGGAGTSRVFTVATGVEAYLYRMTIAGGNAFPADGGNILNQGDLLMLNTRVTGGTARAGGGIANTSTGTLLVINSLIDHNAAISLGAGGGIFDEGDLTINNSTIAFNSSSGELGGGGIATTTAADLFAVTIARNTSTVGAAGLSGGSETINFYGSLVAENRRATTLANCSGIINDDDGTNLADNGCFEITGNPGLGTELVNRGGDTDVLTITPGGAAKGFVTPCIGGNDQRNAPRTSLGTCDAGAFEEGVEAPPIDSSAFPDPTPQQPVITPPVFTPPPVASQEPIPVVNKIIVAKEVSGRVRIKLPGTNRFIELDATQGIPVGSSVDTKQGVVELTSIPKAGAAPEKAQFRQGIFLLTQKAGITDLKLTEGLSCPKRGAKAAAKKPKSRKLWGKGTGKFRTTGNYSAATVRGTEWLVQDTCSGTLTRVTQGVVAVRDNVKKKTILVRGPRGRYTAKPRK